MSEEAEAPARADLRLPLLAVAAWLAGIASLLVPGIGVLGPVVLGGLLAVLAVWARRRFGRVRAWPGWPTVAAVVLVATAVAGSALVREHRLAHNPVAVLAGERAAVELVGVVADDPRQVAGQFATETLVRLDVRQVTGRGRTQGVRVPVLVIGDDAWSELRLGATVRLTARLAPADGGGADQVAALVIGPGPPTVVARPSVWWRASGAVRDAIRASVSGRPADQQALVPGVVDGDDSGLDPALADDFKTTGLTHITAVSGTNLTLLVGFLLIVARWCGVRGRWLQMVAGLGIVGFVLLARTEPSVLRAAVMGTIALIGLGTHARARAFRGLALAVVVLLLLQPALALSAGFALSALATGGILVLAPGWRDALARWLPLPVAEAIAVPAAAQLACTPLVAGLSGQVSLVAVGANLLAAPAVGPATVLGLAAGLVGLVCPPLARVLGALAGWCVAWIAVVARHGAALPVPAVHWGTGALALAALTAITVLLVVVMPRLLRRPASGLALAGLLVAASLVRLPTPGWPGSWAFAMCDVGQGDGLVLDAGPGNAVVVDAGPDPAPMKRCLDSLGVRQVPLVVLTHFHADHVDGLAGVFAGRSVDRLWVTRLQDPPEGVRLVQQTAAAHGLSPSLPAFGQVTTVGAVRLQVLYPAAGPAYPGPGDGSTANNASVVLLAQVDGLSLLLTGDVEPPGQSELAAALPGLHVDVLKVPHHGSRYQDLGWLASLGAREALISVGADNDYGHPAATTVDALRADGATVWRTDEDGTILVGAVAGGMTVRSQHGSGLQPTG